MKLSKGFATIIRAIYPLVILAAIALIFLFVIPVPLISVLAIYVSAFFLIRALAIIDIELFGGELKKGGVNSMPTTPRPDPPKGAGVPNLGTIHVEIKLRE